MKPGADNITYHGAEIEAGERERLLGQRGCVLWFTGLSGSGKSTIARALEARLVRAGHACYVLDGDNIRHGLNGDLGFAPEDRAENVRRIGEVAALFADAGLLTIVAFISPYRADRARARAAAGDGRFLELFVDTPLQVCEDRDPKGLYRKARAGEIADFTGLTAPYEAPAQPELRLDAGALDVAACAEQVHAELASRGYLRAPEGKR